MKKILVTGADGFIGSHLVEYLVENNYPVKAFCYYNSFSHCGWLLELNKAVKSEIEFVYGDIRDSDYVRACAQGCDVIIHLASLIAIPYSYHAPRSYIETNITGTLNVLMAAKENGARVIHTSTSEVYGTAEYIPIDEKHPLKAQSPYAATKIGADQLAMSFYASYDIPVSIVRPFNTFGPRQSIRAIIPTIISQLLNRKVLTLGDIETTRDFSYVKDTAKGIAAFLDAADTIGKAINLGTGHEFSIKDVATEIAAILNVTAEFQVDKDRLRPLNSEVKQLCSDNSMARSLLHWSPTYNGLEGFREGLAETIEWFKNYKGLKLEHSALDFVY